MEKCCICHQRVHFYKLYKHAGHTDHGERLYVTDYMSCHATVQKFEDWRLSQNLRHSIAIRPHKKPRSHTRSGKERGGAVAEVGSSALPFPVGQSGTAKA